MAYRIYSTRLLAFSADPTPPPYEVPAGYIVVVRDIDLSSAGGAITNYQAGIAAGAVIWRGQFTEESLGQAAQWRGRQVLFAGEVFYVSADVAIDGAVSGYLLASDLRG